MTKSRKVTAISIWLVVGTVLLIAIDLIKVVLRPSPLASLVSDVLYPLLFAFSGGVLLGWRSSWGFALVLGLMVAGIFTAFFLTAELLFAPRVGPNWQWGYEQGAVLWGGKSPSSSSGTRVSMVEPAENGLATTPPLPPP